MHDARAWNAKANKLDEFGPFACWVLKQNWCLVSLWFFFLGSLCYTVTATFPYFDPSSSNTWLNYCTKKLNFLGALLYLLEALIDIVCVWQSVWDLVLSYSTSLLYQPSSQCFALGGCCIVSFAQGRQTVDVDGQLMELLGCRTGLSGSGNLELPSTLQMMRQDAYFWMAFWFAVSSICYLVQEVLGDYFSEFSWSQDLANLSGQIGAWLFLFDSLIGVGRWWGDDELVGKEQNQAHRVLERDSESEEISGPTRVFETMGLGQQELAMVLYANNPERKLLGGWKGVDWNYWGVLWFLIGSVLTVVQLWYQAVWLNLASELAWLFDAGFYYLDYLASKSDSETAATRATSPVSSLVSHEIYL